MTHTDQAVGLYNDGLLCSQAVLSAFAQETGLSGKQARMLGTCFGSGMVKGEVCGACSGALMVLGLLYGQSDKDDTAGRKHACDAATAFLERFAEQCGSYKCNDLLGCDLRTEAGVAYARGRNLFRDFCPQMVAHAVRILEEIIREQEQRT